ncbi:MAG: hypothetical protein ABSD08_20240 [Xanthobacteraceae bacterium]
MLEADRPLLAVEIAYLAVSHADEPERKSRFSGIEEAEINQIRQQLLERIDVI